MEYDLFASGGPITKSEGVYQRDYQFVISKLNYSGQSGNYTTVAKTVYEGTELFSSPVNVFNIPHNDELNFTVTDVVEHPTLPILYMTDKAGKKLHAYNYETKEDTFISFELEPESLAFSNDEIYVSLLKAPHDSYIDDSQEQGAIAIVDATTFELVEQFDVAIDPYDIEVSDDGYIYVTSGSSQWTSMKSYSRATKQQIDASGIRQLSYAKLHPTLERLYTIDTDSSPRDITAYNISAGHFTDPSYPGGYDSRYHGEYAMAENMRISPDGKYIFNGAGTVFATEASNYEDMKYWWQYGWDAGNAGSDVYNYSIKGNTFTRVAKSNLGYGGLDRDPLDTPVILLEDRDLLICKNKVFGMNDLTQVVATFPEPIYAVDTVRDLAVGKTGTYRLSDSTAIAYVPVKNADTTFFGDDGLFYMLQKSNATLYYSTLSEKDITAFSAAGQAETAAIDTVNHKVTFHVNGTANISSLKPDIKVSNGAKISPASGTAHDFSLPGTYTVTASDGSTQTWEVICIVDTAVTDKTISGRISLPQGEVAPHGGVSLTINAINSFNGSFYTTVSIPEGQNSCEYEVSVPENFAYKMKYQITTGNTSNSYESIGYYAASGTAKDSTSYTPVSVTNANRGNIDFTILRYVAPADSSHDRDSSSNKDKPSSSGNSSGNSGTTETSTKGSAQVSVSAALNTSNEAVAAVKVEDLNKTLEQAPTDLNGTKMVAVVIPKVEGATAYILELPASTVTMENATQKIEVKTDIGSVTFPSNILDAEELETAQSIVIRIAEADKDKLSEELINKIGQRQVIDLSIQVNGKTIQWENPDAPVSVSVPYTPTEAELKNHEHIVVWYIDGSGKIKPVPNAKYNPETGRINFSVTHFSYYAVGYEFKTFVDIECCPWAEESIEVLASKGIINGTSSTTFKPEAGITRADYLCLLVRALGLTTKVDTNFEDVKPESYYYEALGLAKKLGLANGSGDNKFDPNEAITRQDMMVLDARALKLANHISFSGTEQDLERFTDKASIAGYAEASLAGMVKEGIINGNGNLIDPQDNATRAEAAVIVYRILNR